MIHDVAASVAWSGITTLVLLTAWTAARRAFPGDAVAQNAMHIVVLCWTWLAVAGCAIGSLGLLNATTLGTAVLSLGAVTARLLPSQSSDCRAMDSDRESNLLPARDGVPWAAFWCGIASISAAALLTRGITEFPKNWDTLAYHRPLIDLWIQTGALRVLECPVWFAPGNNELVGLWCAIPFSGDFWVGLMNVPAVLIFALGIHELGHVLDLTPAWRNGAAIAAAGTSVVLHQLTCGKNDIAVAGLFVVALAYVQRFLRDGTWIALVFAGLATGLLCGIKYYALGYACVLWGVGVATTWLMRGWRRGLAAAIVTGSLMVPSSAYWYLRNYAASGSPLFPMGYRGDLYPDLQVRRDPWRSSLLGNGEFDRWLDYVVVVGKQSGTCQMLPLLVLPLSFIWVALMTARRTSANLDTNHGPRIAFTACLLGAWLVFLITPLTIREHSRVLESPDQLIRFSQVPLALSVLAFCLLSSDVTRWLWERDGALRVIAFILPLIFLVTATVSFGTNAMALMPGRNYELPMIGVNWIGLLIMWRLLAPQAASAVRDQSPRLTILVATVATAAFAVSTSQLSTSWHAEFARDYDAYFNTQMFAALEKMDRKSVIAALDTRYYPFFGSRRDHRVFRPQRFTSRDRTLASFIANEISVVAVVMKPGSDVELNSYVAHQHWMNAAPDLFEPIPVAGNGFQAYRIRRERLPSSLDDP